MSLSDFTTEDLLAELNARAEESHTMRQRRIFCGESRETTDGDQHIETNGGVFRGVRLSQREF